MARGFVLLSPMLLVPVLTLAACSPEPIEYIPPSDRALLQAQARLGDAPGASSAPISVDEMLSRARTAQPPQPPAPPLRLQFTGDAVQPDDQQKQSLARFAAAAHGHTVTVVSRRGGFDDPTALLGQRRALAVAHVLEGSIADVELRFDAAAPGDTVLVSVATPEPEAAP